MAHQAAVVTVVTGHVCPLYADVLRILDQVGERHPLKVREVLVGSPEADALIDEHAPAMLPLVLVDGTYLSEGPLPRAELEARLAASEAAALV
ncbi:hypothetical protein [Georgenia sp. SUBG003]|uniref:hypothetical protein n=1 Tax=Georgenia sp. SUBG003 TaxID=1497974 RepID=UPI0005B7D0B1